MEPYGYLLLIAALLLLAGLMLYARFAGSANRKSLHHAPSDWVGVSSAAVAGSDFAVEGGPEPVAPAEAESAPQLRLDQGLPPREGVRVDGTEGQRSYLDELQEAAAGLAMLMRSSPAARSQPVLFEPVEAADEGVADEMLQEAGPSVAGDGSEAADSSCAEALLTETLPAEATLDEESESSAVEEAGPFEAEAEEPAEAVGHPLEEPEDAVGAILEPSGFSEVEAKAEAERERTLDELLGADVAEQFARIDGALDLLDELVGGLESGLRLLQDPVEEFAPASFDETPEDVSVAA